ncbi:non-canonical purine NTP pyrophosphatase, partial [Paenibacillus sepulcri]|nr:non-canonical purine NTP pyrophosphatase [Paenibacillus sepulcri]
GENARKKAKTVAKALDLMVLADDSGLVVDALDGRPGIYSARYAGEGASDALNNAKLLDELSQLGAAVSIKAEQGTAPQGKTKLLSKARFVCAL